MSEAPLPPPPEQVFGWKDIASALTVSERTAQEYAARNRDPLPVEVGHRGAWAYVTALRDWMRRQNVPYRTHLELKRAGLPGGRRSQVRESDAE